MIPSFLEENSPHSAQRSQREKNIKQVLPERSGEYAPPALGGAGFLEFGKSDSFENSQGDVVHQLARPRLAHYLSGLDNAWESIGGLTATE